MAWSELEPFEPAEPGGDRRFVPAVVRANTAFLPHVRPLGVDPSNAMPRGAGPRELGALDIEAIRKEAYAQGEAAGRAQLPWEDAAALRRAIAALDDAATALSRQRRSHLVASRRAIVDLAGAMAERIVARTLALDRSALAALVGEAIASFEPDEPLIVALSPSDLEAVRVALSPGPGAEPPDRALCFAADASLEPGSARISSRSGEARASMDLALARLHAGLEELLAAASIALPDASERNAELSTTSTEGPGRAAKGEMAADPTSDPMRAGSDDAIAAMARDAVEGSASSRAENSDTAPPSVLDDAASVTWPTSRKRARRKVAAEATSEPTPAPAHPRRTART